MAENKIRLDWDDLNTPAIDKRIEEDRKIEQQRKGLERPIAIGVEQGKPSLWLNALFYLTIAGLCFGFISWGAGEVYHLDDEYRTEQYLHKQIRELQSDGTYTLAEAKRVLKARMQRWTRTGSAVWFGIIGLILGFGLGAAEGAAMRSPKKAIVEGLVGMAVGCIGGLIAGYVGQAVYASMSSDESNPTVSPARIVGWAIAGAFLGVAQGAARPVPKRVLYGLIGGLIGGVLGGLFFDPTARIAHSDKISRFIGVCAVGAGIGFFVGLVEALAKDAWIRVAAGRLSGKQFIAYRNPTIIGSEVSSDVYLFRDENVAPQHAAIWRVAGGFEIEDLNSSTGTLLNDQTVRRAKLRAGDQIRIGSNLLIFEEKEKRRVR